MEEAFQDRYRRHTSRADRGACLTAEEIAALAGAGQGSELDAEARRRAVLHLADCSDCSLELRKARSLEPWAADLAAQLDLGSGTTADAAAGGVVDLESARRVRQTARREVQDRDRGGRRRWIPAAMAAGLALVVASVGLLVPSAPTPEPAVTRSASVTALQPHADAVVDVAPQRFSWPAQLGAESYRVRLFDARAELLWESEPLARNESELPASVQHRLESTGGYFWTVNVSGPVARSQLGPFAFRVGPE
ncbi:MAG: hypothetical protein AAF560_21945 [Acidobacteriota bacterium]